VVSVLWLASTELDTTGLCHAFSGEPGCPPPRANPDEQETHVERCGQVLGFLGQRQGHGEPVDLDRGQGQRDEQPVGDQQGLAGRCSCSGPVSMTTCSQSHLIWLTPPARSRTGLAMTGNARSLDCSDQRNALVLGSASMSTVRPLRVSPATSNTADVILPTHP